MTNSQIDYGDLVRELHQAAAAQRQPLNGTFELTERCNLKCSMCYISQPAGDNKQRSRELSSSAWVDLAREAVDSGMVYLLLTGGEVFLRNDFFDIYEPLTQLGVVLTVFSNGTLINDNVARQLAASSPSRVEITIYGATQETYEAVTGVSGSYSRCRTGIDTLLQHDVPLALKTTLTKNNIYELESMKCLARGLGVPFSADSILINRRDKLNSSTIHAHRIAARKSVIIESQSNICIENRTTDGADKPLQPNKRNFYCQAGHAAFVINAIGNMNVCVDLPLPAARPTESGFRAAWDEVQRFVDNAPPVTNKCLTCEDRNSCPRCPAWSFSEFGNLTEPVSYLCDIAHVRKNM